MKSTIDLKSRLGKSQARKLLSEILSQEAHQISFSKHCREQLKVRNLTTVDLNNVLRGGQILKDPEFENGSYRYQVETKKITVVIAFENPYFVRCVTAWRK